MLHAEVAARGPLLITPHRAPEALFGLTPVEVDGHTANGTMRTVEWMTPRASRPRRQAHRRASRSSVVKWWPRHRPVNCKVGKSTRR